MLTLPAAFRRSLSVSPSSCPTMRWTDTVVGTPSLVPAPVSSSTSATIVFAASTLGRRPCHNVTALPYISAIGVYSGSRLDCSSDDSYKLKH